MSELHEEHYMPVLKSVQKDSQSQVQGSMTRQDREWGNSVVAPPQENQLSSSLFQMDGM